MNPLYVVGTPIGNLKDITLRALEILREVPVIICERPRHTLKLLSHYGIHGKEIIQHTEANKKRSIPKILGVLKDRPAAFVTDAGTPGISDPGRELIQAIWRNKGKAISIPGPSAILAALSVAGVEANQFLFLGFLPRQESKLEKTISFLEEKGLLGVAFESPYRIKKTLEFLHKAHPSTFVVLAKELTKVHEEVLRGSANEILEEIQKRPKLLRGEFVLLLAPAN